MLYPLPLRKANEGARYVEAWLIMKEARDELDTMAA